jgi:hypothetical protein
VQRILTDARHLIVELRDPSLSLHSILAALLLSSQSLLRSPQAALATGQGSWILEHSPVTRYCKTLDPYVNPNHFGSRSLKYVWNFDLAG